MSAAVANGTSFEAQFGIRHSAFAWYEEVTGEHDVRQFVIDKVVAALKPQFPTAEVTRTQFTRLGTPRSGDVIQAEYAVTYVSRGPSGYVVAVKVSVTGYRAQDDPFFVSTGTVTLLVPVSEDGE